jgi:hypothetical protein
MSDNIIGLVPVTFFRNSTGDDVHLLSRSKVEERRTARRHRARLHCDDGVHGAGRAMTTVAARPPANPATDPATNAFHTLGRFPRVNLSIISSEPSTPYRKKGKDRQ